MRFFDAITFGAALAALAMLGLYFLSPAFGFTLKPAVGFAVSGVALLAGTVWALLRPGLLRAPLKQR